MSLKDDIQAEFIDRIKTTHGDPPHDFAEELSHRLKNVSVPQLEAAAEHLIRTKKLKTFPSFADCLMAIVAEQRRGNPKTEAGIGAASYLQLALAHMRSHQNGDGTGGYHAQPGSLQWTAWRAYFEFYQIPHTLMDRLETMPPGVSPGYLVPAEWPDQFDASAPKDLIDKQEIKMPLFKDEDEAFVWLKGSELAKRAAAERWIGPLVRFARQQGRLPIEAEIPELIETERRFEIAVAESTTTMFAAMGKAMIAKRRKWAILVLDWTAGDAEWNAKNPVVAAVIPF